MKTTIDVGCNAQAFGHSVADEWRAPKKYMCTWKENGASRNERNEWNAIKTEEKRKMRIKTMRKWLNGVLNYCCVGLWFSDELMPHRSIPFVRHANELLLLLVFFLIFFFFHFHLLI